MGPLSDRFGRRPVVLASVGVFALGSLGCAMATDIRAFLTCRLMQAAITSVYPVSMATIRDTGGGARAASGSAMRRWRLRSRRCSARRSAARSTRRWAGARASGCSARWASRCSSGVRSTSSKPMRTGRRASGSSFARIRRCSARVVSGPTRSAWRFRPARSTRSSRRAARGASGVRHRAGGDRLLHGDHHGRLRVRQLPGARYARRYALATTILFGRAVACAGPLIGLALRFGGATQAIAWFGPCVLVGIGNGLTNPGAHAGAVSVRPALAGSASGLAGAMTIAGGAALSSLTGRC